MRARCRWMSGRPRWGVAGHQRCLRFVIQAGQSYRAVSRRQRYAVAELSAQCRSPFICWHIVPSAAVPLAAAAIGCAHSYRALALRLSYPSQLLIAACWAAMRVVAELVACTKSCEVELESAPAVGGRSRPCPTLDASGINMSISILASACPRGSTFRCEQGGTTVVQFE